MSLLDQEVKKEEPKGKKIVLFLLILSVFALIMVIVMMMAISEKQPKNLTISINGNEIEIEEGLMTVDQNGAQYISIRKIAKPIGYNYLTGEYKQYNEDTTNTKCYLESANQIIQFEAGNDKIYKIDPKSNLDYEEYQLSNKVLKENNLLYVALEDLEVALNVIDSYSQNDNKISLKTIGTLYTEYKTSLSTKTNNTLIGISDEFNNKKAIAHDMLIVSNESGKWGVVKSTDFSTIIGNKYSSIEFIESAKIFIVSDNNKFGVINAEGKKIIDLNYDSIKIINNNPLCYAVRVGENCAIVDKEGNLITNNLYNGVGYTSQIPTEESVLVIKELDAAKVNLLVVSKNGKYGLLYLDDGISIGECILDKIYSKTEGGKKTYYVKMQDQEILLKEYIQNINTTTIDTTTINVGQ